MENANFPVMTMICGPNGAGKSTYTKAKALMSNCFAIVIDPDQLYVQKALSTIEAGKMASSQAKKFIVDKQSFVRESTLTAHFDFELIKLAKSQGYKVSLVFIGLDSEKDAIARVKHRHIKGGHNVPENDIVRRYFRSLNNLPQAIKLVDAALLLHNTKNAYENVAYFEHGNLIQVYSRPSWYNRLDEQLLTQNKQTPEAEQTQLIVSNAVKINQEHQFLIDVSQTYTETLKTYLTAKELQVDRLETKLNAAISQQQDKLRQTEKNKPGIICSLWRGAAWENQKQSQRLRLGNLKNRLSLVKYIGREMTGNRLLALATKKLERHEPDLVAKHREQERLESKRKQLAMQQKLQQANKQAKTQSLGMTRTIGH